MHVMRKANAKINIGLFIRGRRPDGYHELQTLFYPIPQLYDDIEVGKQDAGLSTTLTATGLEGIGPVEDNLCYRAWAALAKADNRVGPVHIRLHKRIPMGAGLGGGSADAAAVLMAVDELFGLQLGKEKLRQIGLQLGADVPFFIENRPMLAKGIGERLEEFAINIPYRIELVTPPVHSNTAEAYRGLDLAATTQHADLRQLLRQPIGQWRDNVKNDFEPSVFARYPQLAQLKQDLYNRGAVYAAMSGSGSALFGFFEP